MLNVFQMAQVLQETGNGFQASSVPTFKFATDSLSECTAEFNYGMMLETTSFHQFCVGSDEILAEAAMNRSPNMEILQENVFQSVKAAVVKFYNKIIGWIKGIIEKLKAMFYKHTGKLDKWAKIVEPKIKEFSSKAGNSELTYSMYKWNEEIVSNGQGGSKLCDVTGEVIDAIAKFLPDADEKPAKVLREAKKKAEEGARNYRGKNADDKDVQRDVDAEKLALKDLPKKEDYEKLLCAILSKAASGERVNEVQDFANIITKAAHGGDSEKTEQKIGDPMHMLEVVKNSGKVLEKLEKAYSKNLKVITDAKSRIEKVGDEIDLSKKKDETIPANVVAQAQASYKAYYDAIMQIINMMESACNNCQSLNVSLMNQMVSDYTGALSKAASFKGKKED